MCYLLSHELTFTLEFRKRGQWSREEDTSLRVQGRRFQQSTERSVTIRGTENPNLQTSTRLGPYNDLCVPSEPVSLQLSVLYDLNIE